MQIRTPTMTLGVLLLMAACTPVAAQPSLADVARQEAARRKEAGTSTKVYTNKDVTRGRPLTTAAAIAKPPDPAATPDSAPSSAAAPASAADASGATASAAMSAEPDTAERREQLARLTEAAAVALGQADRLNATIVNLFDETQRRLAIEERDRQLSDYRLRQAEIEQINKQVGEPQQAPIKAPAADPPQPR